MTVLTVDEVAQVMSRWACGACGGEKESGRAFCRECYFLLPSPVRRRMFRRDMEDVAKGVNDCRAWLAAQRPDAGVARAPAPP